MADEILLKAPKVEQQVNITISGENKLYDIADTINCMLNGRNLQDYWKSKQQLFIDLVQAKADYCSNQTEINAKRFIKIANAYKAWGTNNYAQNAFLLLLFALRCAIIFL